MIRKPAKDATLVSRDAQIAPQKQIVMFAIQNSAMNSTKMETNARFNVLL